MSNYWLQLAYVQRGCDEETRALLTHESPDVIARLAEERRRIGELFDTLGIYEEADSDN